jgi:hypothetical protein
LGEGIVPGTFNANVETHPQRYGSRPREVLFKARKQLAQGALAAEQQPMDVPRLRCPCPVRGLRGKSVALQNNNAIEAVGERARGGEPSHSSADHHGLLADQS